VLDEDPVAEIGGGAKQHGHGGERRAMLPSDAGDVTPRQRCTRYG